MAVANPLMRDVVAPAAAPRGRRRFRPREAGKSFLFTFIVVVVLAAFLSPLIRSVFVSLQTPDQVGQLDAPPYPAVHATFDYQGKTYDVYNVPIDGATKSLALVIKGRESSKFVDPTNPSGGLIVWQGSWRNLDRSWSFAPEWSNYSTVWDQIDFPRLLFNTVAIALIGMIGTILSCTLVAYGFARFRFPGRSLLFTILIATIFLPYAVTIIPTYTVFRELGWVGTWLPLLVPTFFANAYDVFLLRQYLLTIPREMDEAAAIDGAGPFRTLISVIVPQAWPAIIAVSIFHIVYAWNDFFGPLIYLSTKPELQTLALGLAHFNTLHYRNQAFIQVGTLLTMVIPILVFLVFQRFFTRGLVISGVEK
ncbi:MAG TPA: carbohydrate ABC transporter permease [Candidatus Limnocylindrales bacterium]|nr:carbohydrate ABC transporter permease [Candidatus Limnocylindrales bacterium]